MRELKYARQDFKEFAATLQKYCRFSDQKNRLMSCRSEGSCSDIPIIWYFREGIKEPLRWPTLLKKLALSHFVDVPGEQSRWQAARYPLRGRNTIVQSYEGAKLSNIAALIYIRTQTDDLDLRVASIEYGIDWSN
jgi:hypothetical protein